MSLRSAFGLTIEVGYSPYLNIINSWYNSQAILHPFVTYYLDLREIHHVNYVVISDCLHHDTVAVHLFQRSFITFLKELPPARLHPKKIIYVSDDTASQYKNRKNFLNLCHHKDDFGVKT